jgi:hypothetical protein
VFYVNKQNFPSTKDDNRWVDSEEKNNQTKSSEAQRSIVTVFTYTRYRRPCRSRLIRSPREWVCVNVSVRHSRNASAL